MIICDDIGGDGWGWRVEKNKVEWEEDEEVGILSSLNGRVFLIFQCILASLVNRVSLGVSKVMHFEGDMVSMNRLFLIK